MSVTFKVNPVEPSTTKLSDLDEKNFQAFMLKRCGGSIMPEAYSKPERGAVFVAVSNNAFLSTIHTCWSQHYSLVLTPDMIWLCIAQGLAQHVNKNSEKLRSKFVEHEGKKELVVKRSGFKKGSPLNPWPEVLDDFSSQIRSHVGDKTHDLLTPTFSTTGPVERAAAQIVLMNCFKDYFDYRFMCICGIPSITLEGTVEDWEQLRARTMELAEYDLGWWIESLTPILDQFVAAASGKVDQEFWSKIYHYRGSSPYQAGPFVTGWVLTLFPYKENGEKNEFLSLWLQVDPTSHDKEAIEEAERLGTPWFQQNLEDHRGLKHKTFPNGVCSTPFIYQECNEEYPMHFYAGFMTVSQDPTTLALRPEIGWAVADDKKVKGAIKNLEGPGYEIIN